MSKKTAGYGNPAVHNATPPTYADLEEGALQIDANGNLLVSGSITASNPSVGTTGAAAPASATEAGATYNTAPPTPANGQLVSLQADSSGNLKTVSGGSGATADQVQGNIASGSADSGNPVKVGGKVNATLPTLADQQRGDLQVGTRGALYVQLVDGNGINLSTVASAADAGNLSNAFKVQSIGKLYNGTTEDLARGNTEVSILTSGARTTTQTGADQTNVNARGLDVILDVTNAGTGSVTVEIDGKDPVSGKYYPLLTGAAVTSNSTNIYRVYPGLTASANAVANDILPRTWRVVVTANNANSVTYSVGATLVL
jgi:hypothetical protein